MSKWWKHWQWWHWTLGVCLLITLVGVLLLSTGLGFGGNLIFISMLLIMGLAVVMTFAGFFEPVNDVPRVKLKATTLLAIALIVIFFGNLDKRDDAIDSKTTQLLAEVSILRNQVNDLTQQIETLSKMLVERLPDAKP